MATTIDQDELARLAEHSLEFLCGVKPNRRTGSAGNRAATGYIADSIKKCGFDIDVAPFDCLDYACEEAFLSRGDSTYDVHASPYSLGCDVQASLASASTLAGLESLDCAGKLLLLHGDLCAEQLMPKNFYFYNPPHHQELIALLERKSPAAIITATAGNPEQVGALNPYPLFVDGDFDIPSLYCKVETGQAILSAGPGSFQIKIDARRIPSTAANVIARLNPTADNRILLTAHLDGYEDTPGALDNASGTTVLLLCAHLLSSYHGGHCLELTAFNGEDHYSAAGQKDYLERYHDSLQEIRLVINIDDVGCRNGRTAYSCLQCPVGIEQSAREVFEQNPEFRLGEPWYNGDHMIFVQRSVPAIALTSDQGMELMKTITHTSLDTQDRVDCRKLVQVALAITELVKAF